MNAFGRPTAMLVLAVLAGTVLGGCGYNTMVDLEERVEATWAQVENQLQRRNDLIPNLVEVTKGYAAHEQELFTEIADARSRLMRAPDRAEQIDAAQGLSGALSRLLALSERYPDLKANTQFTRLSDELAGTENRIATERRRYNEAVRAYNTYIKRLPQRLYAGTFGFEPVTYFEVPEDAQQVPEVEF